MHGAYRFRKSLWQNTKRSFKLGINEKQVPKMYVNKGSSTSVKSISGVTEDFSAGVVYLE